MDKQTMRGLSTFTLTARLTNSEGDTNREKTGQKKKTSRNGEYTTQYCTARPKEKRSRFSNVGARQRQTARRLGPTAARGGIDFGTSGIGKASQKKGDEIQVETADREMREAT